MEDKYISKLIRNYNNYFQADWIEGIEENKIVENIQKINDFIVEIFELIGKGRFKF